MSWIDVSLPVSFGGVIGSLSCRIITVGLLPIPILFSDGTSPCSVDSGRRRRRQSAGRKEWGGGDDDDDINDYHGVN